MKILKLAFVDFAVNWGPWPNPVQFFADVLKDDYDVRVVKSDFRGYIVEAGDPPDLVICGHPGSEHEQYFCPKIYFPGEPRSLNLMNYDYEMSYHFSDDPRHYRLPLYPLYGDVNRLTQPRIFSQDMRMREFCCVLFGKSYPHNETPREDFFHRLCKYKKVDSAGTHLNNTGYVIPHKQKAEYIKNYKFVLSFESCSRPGFTTEKIYEPLLMNTVPVYWGNPKIGLDFDTRSFINSGDYENLDQVIDAIIKADTDDEVYKDIIEWTAFPHNVVNEYVRKRNIVEFFRGILG